MPIWFPMAPAFACFISTTASLILLCWLCKLNESLARRLIARQLWHLALADVFASGLLFPWFTLAILRAGDPTFGGDEDTVNVPLNILCAVCHGNNIPYMTSVFVELHISLSAIATIMRRPEALKALAKYLPSVWVLGTVVGGAVEAFGQARWDGDSGGCQPKASGEVIKGVVMALVLVACIVIYVSGMILAARRHGGSVEGRAWRRASVFITAAVVTWVPFVIFSLRPRKHNDNLYDSNSKRWYYVMSVFLESNGILNAVVYAWQSGFLRRNVDRAKFICDAQDTTASLPLAVSFNVAFRSSVDVVPVPADTAMINATASAEATAMREEKRATKMATLDVGAETPPKPSSSFAPPPI